MPKIVHDELRAVWISTQDLHKRFFSDKPPTFQARYRVFMEEVAEFTLDLTNTGENEPFVVHEAADVLVTLIGLLQGYGIEFGEFCEAIESVVDKNDAKTLETHFIRPDGKISKRVMSTEQQEAMK